MASVKVGEVLSRRYRLDAVIGSGAMAVVFAAHDLHSGASVAIKALRERFVSSPQALARFHREAEVAARVVHPNVVSVLGVGSDGVCPYLVMERLEGESLGVRLRREKRLPVSEAVVIARAVLSALAATHAIGVVHRDLKPENVFLVGGDPARVKVLDFGVSKVGPGNDDTQLSREGDLLGTPAYMSPEQWLNAAQCDARCDLWAVGVMLYEMVSGALPFQAPSRVELFVEVARGSTPPRSLAEVDAALPAGLDAVVMKALRRSLDERVASAEALSAALAPFADHAKETAAEGWAEADLSDRHKLQPAQPTAWSHRTPAPWWAWVLVVIAVGATLALFAGLPRG